MRIKLSGDLAFLIASYESDRNWELEIENAPRKKKKRLKKELAKVIINMIEKRSKEIFDSYHD